MNKHINPPCNSHVIHQSMSGFEPEDVTSPFAETDSSILEAALVVHPPLFPNPLAEIMLEEKSDERCWGVFEGDR